jgi:hypothetical protein
VCLLLSSCIDSKSPLCNPDDAKIDAALIGAWQARLGDGSLDCYHVGIAGDKLPSGIFRFVTVDRDKNGKLSRPGEMLGFSTMIGKDRYLNVAFIDDKDLGQFETTGWKPELVKGFVILKYHIDGDTLTVWKMDPQAKQRLIESEKAKGSINKNVIFLTDATDNVVSLLTDPKNADLFTKTPAKFQRVK